LPPVIPAQFLQPIEPNREIVSITMPGIDGLPLATIGLAPESGATSISSNLTVPYAPCTLPIGSGCDIGPWPAACDFESGRITWTQATTLTLPTVRVALRDVAGSSALCTTGTYQLEATVRTTGRRCGSVAAPTECTLVDQTFSLPLVATGRKLDATATLPLGDLRFNDRFTSTEVVSARLIDPTGQVVAVPGQGSTFGLEKLQVVMNGGDLRLKATIPVSSPDQTFDPAELDGFTVRIADRNDVVYVVTIPPVFWQLQTPLGSGWTYEDPGGALGGLRSLRIRRVGSAGKVRGYKLDLRASGVDLSAADFPGVTVTTEVDDGVFLNLVSGRGNRTCLVKGPKRICK
jgi:hypothetical protein